MRGPYVADGAAFLIEAVFGFYILVVMLRFLLQFCRADFYNPVSQFVVKITAPALHPLRRWLPGLHGIDVAALVLMLGLKLIELRLGYLVVGVAPALGGLFIVSVAELLELLIYVFLIAIIIQVVMSWVAPYSDNPVSPLLDSIAEPLLAPARSLLPSIGGLDLSPFLVLVLLQLTLKMLIAPLSDLGHSLL